MFKSYSFSNTIRYLFTSVKVSFTQSKSATHFPLLRRGRFKIFKNPSLSLKLNFHHCRVKIPIISTKPSTMKYSRTVSLKRRWSR